jgi:hypothetical protein
MQIDPGLKLKLYPPFRVPRSKLIKSGVLENYVNLAARRAGSGGSLLIVLDSDDDNPLELGDRLLERALAARGDLAISVVVAHRELESWFLAAAESLRGIRGLATDLTAPADPEAIRGAKEWLSAHMEEGRSYSSVLDQPAMASAFDIVAARHHSPSFDRFYYAVIRLLAIRSERE